jgi:hypothetical protein
MTQCEYLGRKFKLSSKMIKTLQAVELSTELDYTEQETAGGLPQLAIKGYKPQSMSIGYTCVTSAGVNPYEEYCEWKKLIGKSSEFYVGSEQFGIDVFTLKGVALNGGKVNVRGQFLTGTITLDLSQDIVATEGN